MNSEEVFLTAIEKQAGEERQQYLDEVFAVHPQLRTDVLALLASHEQAGSFLGAPIVGPRPPLEGLEVDLFVGMQIGDYRVLKQIGQGGMGLVYLAEQSTPVQRQVAIKILKPALASHSVLARFEAERQAIAMMDHPNIAKIYEAGQTSTGQPYFVMELLDGIPITKYCDQEHLNPQQRLELMISVCQAIQHAHQKGIIHRDIKPANVLVTTYDGVPVPKVIDFGIAKAIDVKLTDASIYTDFGAILGTLEYMSPEQAGAAPMDIDTRTDIFSLGILLYELLTGTTPIGRRELHDAALVEVLRTIRDVEPPKPSTRISTVDEAPSVAANRSIEPARLIGLVRGDLDWIAMKALEKDRARRYQSARELADDLQRFLEHEPVLAAAPSRWYRVRKFVRRNRLPVFMGSLVFLALLGGVIGTSLGLVQSVQQRKAKERALEDVRLERDQKSLALAQAEKENEEKTRALTAETAARKEADAATERAILALQTLTDEAVDRLMSSQPQLSDANRKFIDQILDQLAEFTKSTDGSIKARVVHADGLNQIGNLKGRLGDHAGAIAAFRDAIRIWESLVSNVLDKPDYRRGLADAWSNLGIYLAKEKQFKESEAAHLRAIEMHLQLANDFPDNVSYQTNVANCRNSYGVMLKDVQRNQETVSQYEQAVAIYENVLAKEPTQTKALIAMTNVQNNLAIELFLAGKIDESLAAHHKLIEAREKIVQSNESDARDRYLLAMSMVNLGLVLRSQNKVNELIPILERAESLTAAVINELPAVVEYREGYAGLLDMLASGYVSQRDWSKSAQILNRLQQLFMQLSREFPNRSDLAFQIGRTYGRVAMSNERGGDTSAAENNYRLSINKMQETLASDSLNPDYSFQLANMRYAYATLLLKLERQPEAIDMYDAGVKTMADVKTALKQGTREHQLHYRLLLDLTTALMAAQRYSEAALRSERLLEICLEKDRQRMGLLRARCLAPSDAAAAILQAKAAVAVAPPTPAALYMAAQAVAASVPQIASEPEREAAIKLVLEYLNQAKEAKFFESPDMLKRFDAERDFEPLRQRQEFKELVESFKTQN
jgi:serine/threonine protein kinase